MPLQNPLLDLKRTEVGGHIMGWYAADKLNLDIGTSITKWYDLSGNYNPFADTDASSTANPV